MKRSKQHYAPSTLLAIGLAASIGLAAFIGLAYDAIAQEQRSPSNQVQKIYEANQDQHENNGQTHSVPDAGSTAALLGLSVALVVFGQRKFAIVR